MREASQTTRVVRFGVFEADLRTAELRKQGVRIRLSGQSFQILEALLLRPGELITRDELKQKLWPSDSFGDFEHGLNAAVNRVREALGDSPENPRFVETLPRRGYRFIAPVEGNSVEAEDAPYLRSGTPLLETQQGSGPIDGSSQDHDWRGPADRLKTTRSKNLVRPGITAGAVAVLFLICGAIWYRQPQPPTVTNTVRISNDGKAKSPMNGAVTDGAHLYFMEGMPWTSGSGIAQMAATGGETTWISTTLREVLAIYCISPDRSKLLVVTGVAAGPTGASEIWVQPLPAGAPHRAGNIVASAACWTPDGTHIVYAHKHAVMIANQDGSEPHPLANVPGIARALRFSPDGRRIRFYMTRYKADSSSIWEMDANGKDVHPLFPDWKDSPFQCCGNWSTDGDYYYFVAGRGDTQAIWVMPERGSIFRRAGVRPSRLASGPLRLSAPITSSDGKKLFVVGEEPRVELFRYDLRARRFDSYLWGLSAGPVDFSPDRKWMAYITYPDMTLWRSRIDGSDKIRLTFPPVRAYEPRWSPDGSKIAFMDVQFNRTWRISLISSLGGNPELLERASTDESEADPTWTPDGRSIVFGKSAGDGIAIYRLDLETRKVFPIPDSDGIFSPRVSPDGRYISALTVGETKLMLFDTSTNHWSALLEGEAVSYNEWSHDGRYIYVRENRGGAAELVRMRMKDRVKEDVLSLKDFPAPADAYAIWIGLTPDDAPLLMRDRSVQEIYALDLRLP
jgi:Tol biopolymer transport system component/DNA-binding winged helix-turn-helix (wHTH) protein